MTPTSVRKKLPPTRYTEGEKDFILRYFQEEHERKGGSLEFVKASANAMFMERFKRTVAENSLVNQYRKMKKSGKVKESLKNTDEPTHVLLILKDDAKGIPIHPIVAFGKPHLERVCAETAAKYGGTMPKHKIMIPGRFVATIQEIPE